MARKFLSFCVRQRMTLSLGFYGVIPQKHNLSRLEPNWRPSRLKSLEISGPDPEVFTPPVETTVRQSRNGSYYRAQKKIEIISRIIRSTCSRSRLPQEKQGSPPAILLFLEAGIAPRNILYSFQQGSPLVRKIAADKGRPS